MNVNFARDVDQVDSGSGKTSRQKASISDMDGESQQAFTSSKLTKAEIISLVQDARANYQRGEISRGDLKKLILELEE